MKGQNGGLAPGPVRVICQWTEAPSTDADLSALLLSGGKVRDDADFVFYNQPESTDGAVRHDGKRCHSGRIENRISIDPACIEVDVETVALTLSYDGTGSLADLGAVDVAVLDADGSTVAAFTIDDLTTETAAITLELYRRDTTWKVRAVGQGYHDGLAGLARDFGVSVDDEPEPPPSEPNDPAVATGPPPINWTNPPVPAGYEL